MTVSVSVSAYCGCWRFAAVWAKGERRDNETELMTEAITGSSSFFGKLFETTVQPFFGIGLSLVRWNARDCHGCGFWL